MFWLVWLARTVAFVLLREVCFDFFARSIRIQGCEGSSLESATKFGVEGMDASFDLNR